jgi:hypothetical protein
VRELQRIVDTGYEPARLELDGLLDSQDRTPDRLIWFGKAHRRVTMQPARNDGYSRCEPPSWRSRPRRNVWSCAAPDEDEIHVDSVDQNISSTVEGRRLLMAEARAWLSWWPVGSVHCSRTGSGHMGATPQPKGTVASVGNQHGRSSKSGNSNVSECNQRPGESIDTVGVTGSIPVSPTTYRPRNPGPVAISGVVERTVTLVVVQRTCNTSRFPQYVEPLRNRLKVIVEEVRVQVESHRR